MTDIDDHLANYLTIRRTVGFKLSRAELLLTNFVGYLQDRDIDVLTNSTSVEWASLPPASTTSRWHAQRLSVVRMFARYLHLIDPAHEIPPPNVFPTPNQRVAPFIYSSAEIEAMMTAAQGFTNPLRAASMEAIIGLLAVTGIRIGEALRLDRANVDLDNDVLQVFDSKFGKDRLVPIDSSTSVALSAYSKRRDHLSPQPSNPAMFVSAAGTRMLYTNFHNGWRTIIGRSELQARTVRCRPRPHDLRHTFAVNTLRRWYVEGDDVTAKLPTLSTFLGHTHPRDTYWYLTGSPELLGIVVDRLNVKDAGLS